MKSQLPSQFSSVTGINQANRDQVAPSINQITRRPSISSDLSVGPQSIQRTDSRVGIAPQASIQSNQQQIPIQRSIQQQPQQQPNTQPHFQPRQILQQVNKNGYINKFVIVFIIFIILLIYNHVKLYFLKQPPLQQQAPQQFQAPRPLINRGPAPVQQQITGQQQSAPGQQQYQQINRAPVPQQAQQLPQQRPQLIRAPIPAQVQNINSTQPANLNQTSYQSVQNRPSQPQQFNQNLSSDGQGIRLNQPNQQYRPQIQQQQRPINPNYNPNIQKLPTHLEERNRMATEAANPNQPSYLISNSDDVDDVIVRPIGNVSIIFLN